MHQDGLHGTDRLPIKSRHILSGVVLIAPDKLDWFPRQTVKQKVKGGDVSRLLQPDFVLVGSSKFAEEKKKKMCHHRFSDHFQENQGHQVVTFKIAAFLHLNPLA